MDVRRRVSEFFGSLADRLGVSPWSVVIGTLSVAAAAAAGWWAFAAPAPPPVEEVLPRVEEMAPIVTAADAPVAEASTILVHVDGAVARPGVHELPVDARVIDAIDAAAGLLADADRERLNLAAPLLDGQRVWIPRVGEEEPTVIAVEGGVAGGGATGGGGDQGSSGPIDLNRADQAALESLPGIGPSIAGAILQHRDREGPFERVEDLLEVAGIGPSRLAQLEDLVTV
ncbi:MAG: helix-hairpin-helix domain-containing protein [Acidimicrobiales bacterium]